MVTLLDRREKHSESYSTYQEPDTRVPPKARPVLGAISVNGVAIPEQEILAEAQNHPSATPGAALDAAARALTIRALLMQKAAALGIEAEADGEATAVETAEEAAIRRLVEREVQVPSATAEECRRYYDNNRAKFRSEPIFEASHILIAADRADPARRHAARHDAESLAARLAEEPLAFAELARAHSACPSGQQGGNLGQLTRGSTVAEFEAALNRMAEGEITAEPVESRFGFHIIRLERRVDGEFLPFEAVRQRIADWLEASTWSKAMSQYVAILAAEAEIDGIDLLAGDGAPS